MAVETLVKARKSYREAKIIPIADDSILPSVYVRPDIFPCTLLWRPMETEQNKKAMLQILLSMSELTEEEKVLFICVWIVLAPELVIFGAIALSFSLI